ncbi:coadhesin-like [Hydractinia symbiolongicarpus]|uniref:coadhesin-like n=1 Tax=Hydractinia symbiolongicarpus TaxID=13093 RepID=UPI00254D6D79|nr:coadhesin-like [Hydractinia symbiolongicarpus]
MFSTSLSGLFDSHRRLLTGCSAGESSSGERFTEWSLWSDCSITCGLGTASRSRECQLDNGGFCNGTTVETKVCFKTACAIPPIWTTWSAWTECSGTCGSGNRTRQRTCTNSFSCPRSMEVEDCFSGCRLPMCPAKGDDFDCNFETQCWLADESKRWVIGKNTPSENTGPDVDHTFLNGCGHFAYFEASCSKKGDTGSLSTSIKIATISQYCFSFWVSMYSVYPKQMGVLNLYFIQSQNTPTQLWSAHTILTNSSYTWKRISISLNVTIGEGFYVRRITYLHTNTMIFEAIRGFGFNSDMAIDDGKLTEGECKGQVDGHWGIWQQWTPCVVTCGSGVQRRNRTCTSPAPANDGLNCVGPATVTRSCQLKKECPVNGGWCDWSTWSSCSTTCDNSTRYRMRECAEPAPMHGGSQCVKVNGTNGLEELQVESCYNEPCFRLGGWSEWANVTECSVTCGSGTVTRKRKCYNPTPLGEASSCINSKNVPSLEEINALDCYNSCPERG